MAPMAFGVPAEADLASVRDLFSMSKLAAWTGSKSRVVTLKVSAHPFRPDAAQMDLSVISTAAARFEPEPDPQMVKARQELARALAERAKAFDEQETSATTGSTVVPASDEDGEM